MKKWAPRILHPRRTAAPGPASSGSGQGGPGRRLHAGHIVGRVRSSPTSTRKFNQHRYFTNYHIWETLVAWDAPPTTASPASAWMSREEATKSALDSRRQMPEALTSLVRRVSCRVSYNDEGWVSEEALEEMFAASTSRPWPSNPWLHGEAQCGSVCPTPWGEPSGLRQPRVRGGGRSHARHGPGDRGSPSNAPSAVGPGARPLTGGVGGKMSRVSGIRPWSGRPTDRRPRSQLLASSSTRRSGVNFALISVSSSSPRSEAARPCRGRRWCTSGRRSARERRLFDPLLFGVPQSHVRRRPPVEDRPEAGG